MSLSRQVSLERSRIPSSFSPKSWDILSVVQVLCFSSLGSNGCAVMRTLASHQCETGGWLSCWFYPSRERAFSGYSGFPLSVYKNQLLPNTISNWNAQTGAYWDLKAISSVELIFRDLRERGPEKGWQKVCFYEGKNDGLSTLLPAIWLTIQNYANTQLTIMFHI